MWWDFELKRYEGMWLSGERDQVLNYLALDPHRCFIRFCSQRQYWVLREIIFGRGWVRAGMGACLFNFQIRNTELEIYSLLIKHVRLLDVNSKSILLFFFLFYGPQWSVSQDNMGLKHRILCASVSLTLSIASHGTLSKFLYILVPQNSHL